MRRDECVEYAHNQGWRLTFDDVELEPGYAEVMPDQVSLDTKFSRNVPLKVPFVSAAMDTVTEAELAIALAWHGGIGVIHKAQPSERQAGQVGKVKHYIHGRTDAPVCVTDDMTVEQVLNMKQEKKYPFSRFPVINSQGKFVGMFTKHDIEFCENASVRVSQVMTQEDMETGHANMTLDEAHQVMKSRKIKVLPLLDNESRVVGLYAWKDLKRIFSSEPTKHNIDAKGQLRVAAAIGVGENELLRAELLVKKGVDALVIDSAHGDSLPVHQMLKEIVRNFSVDVVVGNISQPEAVEKLVEFGAAGIKVGMGIGSICTTSVIGGAGAPQLSAIYRCARARGISDVPVCADGGIKWSGDITKALGAGAHSIMMGSIFAGTEEAPGEIIHFKGEVFKGYRGMGSIGAMQEKASAKDRYQGNTGKDALIAEGIEGRVKYKGKVADVLFQLEGGLRHGLGYTGSASVKELRDKKAKFAHLTEAGKREAHPHDVEIIKEAPNYFSR